MFRRLFFGCVIVLITLSVAFSLMLFRQIRDKNEAVRAQEDLMRVELLGRLVDEKFASMDQIGTQLSNMSWVNHVRSRSEIMLRDIDVLKRREICSEFATYQAIVRISNSTALLLPHRNIVIDSVSFWPEDSYLASIGLKGRTMDELLQALPDSTTSIVLIPLGDAAGPKSDFLVMKNLDYTTTPELVLFYYVNGNALMRLVNQRASEGLEQFSIWAGNAPVFTSISKTVSDEAYAEHVVPSTLFPWQYRFSFTRQPSPDGLMTVLLICLIMADAVVSAAVSFGLAWVGYTPLSELLQRLGVKSGEASELVAIEDVFRSLREENRSFEALSHQYYHMAKNNLLVLLLNGLFDESVTSDSLRSYGLNLSDNKVYMVALLLSEEEIGKEEQLLHYVRLQEGFSNYTDPVLIVELVDQSIALVVEYLEDDIQSFSSRIDSIREHIEQMMPGMYDVHFGYLYHGLIGISKSYQDAKEHIASGDEPVGYFPSDWERQLTASINGNNRLVAERILVELRAENRSRYNTFPDMQSVACRILDTMLALSGWPSDKVEETRMAFFDAANKGQVDTLWAFLHDCLHAICADGVTSVDASMEIGSQIVAYVDGHIYDAGLSQQSIAVEFGISRPMVSKLFKKANGGNFFDYVHKCRIEKAKHYFEAGNSNVVQVARLVGYDNEVTFKRAFMRLEAITPRKYSSDLSKSE
jgi:AraC-like DNA-binding protein